MPKILLFILRGETNPSYILILSTLFIALLVPIILFLSFLYFFLIWMFFHIWLKWIWKCLSTTQTRHKNTENSRILLIRDKNHRLPTFRIIKYPQRIELHTKCTEFLWFKPFLHVDSEFFNHFLFFFVSWKFRIKGASPIVFVPFLRPLTCTDSFPENGRLRRPKYHGHFDLDMSGIPNYSHQSIIYFSALGSLVQRKVVRILGVPELLSLTALLLPSPYPRFLRLFCQR